MFFSSRNKKSSRQVRVRYQPKLVRLEDRVVPSTAALDALLLPTGHGSLASTSASAAALPSDHGNGDQVSVKAHALQDARTSGDSQGIGTDLSTFVHTLNPASGDDTC